MRARSARCTFSDGVDLFGAGGVFGNSIPGLNTSTGQYAFVFELRSENGRVISRDNAMFSYIDALVPVEGTIGNTTWSANNAYLLTDQVFVGAGSTSRRAAVTISFAIIES